MSVAAGMLKGIMAKYMKWGVGLVLPFLYLERA